MLSFYFGEKPSEKLCPRKSVLFLPLLQSRAGYLWSGNSQRPIWNLILFPSCRNIIARQVTHASGKAGFNLAGASETWPCCAWAVTSLMMCNEAQGHCREVSINIDLSSCSYVLPYSFRVGHKVEHYGGQTWDPATGVFSLYPRQDSQS